MPPAVALILLAGSFVWPGSLAADARAADALSDTARLRAVERLAARGGPAATPYLLPLLRDTDVAVRLFVARRLARAGEPAATDAAITWIMTPVVPQIDRPHGLEILRDAPELPAAGRRAVERALHDPDATVRNHALEVIEVHGVGPSLSYVLAAIDDDNREVRLRAIRLAVNNADPRAALSLLGHVEDADREVRMEAIRALGAFPAALPALMRIATEGADEARLAAIDGLGLQRAEQATPLLAGVARRRPADDPARHAQLALGRIATPAAIAALISLTRTPPITDDTRAALRRGGPAAMTALIRELETGTPTSAATAAALLGEIGDRRAAPALAAALDRRPDLAPTLADALAHVPDRSAIPALARAAESAEPEVRRRALAALIATADPRAVAVLERGLADPDARVRELSATLAATVNAQAATPALAALVNDTDRDVRRAGLTALGSVGIPSARAVSTLLAAITTTGATSTSARRDRDEAEWRVLGAALAHLVAGTDADRLAAAFKAARGPERGPLARGLAAAAGGRALSDEALIDALVAAVSEGGGVALAAADALASARVSGQARRALAAAFAAAEPAVRARLCPALAGASDGGEWLSAVIADVHETSEVRAAAAWAARGDRASSEALAATAEADPTGPLGANARAAQGHEGHQARRDRTADGAWTELQLRAPDGAPEAGRWVAIDAGGGTSVWAKTDPFGEVRLLGLSAGPLSVRVPGSLVRAGSRSAP